MSGARAAVVAVASIVGALVTGPALAADPPPKPPDKKDAPKADAGKKDTDRKDGEEKKDDAKEEKEVAFALSGYVNLGVGFTSVPRAVPRDQLTYGLRSSVAGLIVKGTPLAGFSYVVHFGINPEALDVVSDVDVVDKKGDQTDIDATTRTKEVTLVNVEEVSIAYAITSFWSLKGGHFYMPFSPGASVLVTRQMFPKRPQPTQVFMAGADQGISTDLRFVDDRIIVSAGAFNGSSLELKLPDTTALGPVYSGLVDVQPFGAMPETEGDPKRGPFRFALGMGGMFRQGKLFESTGYEATRFREVRLDAAARVAFRGLFLQAEYLRRLQTDDLSFRPAAANGAYVQGSFFFPIPTTRLAIAPLARYGVATEDEQFAARRSIEIEAGLAFFPRADIDDPNRLRIIVQYEGEQRLPEREMAHGGVAHVQMRW